MNLKLRKLIALGMAVILASGIAIIPMATSDEETELVENLTVEEIKEPEFFTITEEEIPIPIITIEEGMVTSTKEESGCYY